VSTVAELRKYLIPPFKSSKDFTVSYKAISIFIMVLKCFSLQLLVNRYDERRSFGHRDPVTS